MTKEQAKRNQPMARINTRIRHDQHRFIKSLAKKINKTEGEIFREVVDFYIKLK